MRRDTRSCLFSSVTVASLRQGGRVALTDEDGFSSSLGTRGALASDNVTITRPLFGKLIERAETCMLGEEAGLDDDDKKLRANLSEVLNGLSVNNSMARRTMGATASRGAEFYSNPCEPVDLQKLEELTTADSDDDSIVWLTF